MSGQGFRFRLLINPAKPFRTDVNFFNELGNKLIAKSLNYLHEFDTLYLIPHGWLHHLPLHALRCPDGLYLIEKFKIVYCPSSTIIKYCQKKNRIRNKTNYNYSKKSCLSLGTGLIDDSDLVKKSFSVEAQYIGNTIFETNSICKTDKDASKEFFLQNCINMDVIHLACHGFFNQSNPLKSGLILSNGNNFPTIIKDSNKKLIVQEDFLLTAEEILGIDLNSELVVLSACLTGVNENKPGDELIGLIRSLLYAGTPSAILSLWSVYTESTILLMKSFYKYWIKSENIVSKAEALQRAQIDMIRNNTVPEWQHIYHWAPFILVGDWL